MNDKIYAYHSVIEGACGVGVVADFDEDADGWAGDSSTILSGTRGGTGLLCAGFIHKDEVCDKAFAQLSKKYKLLFKSTVRKNVNSGNKFYFAVFDCKGKRVPIGFNACSAKGF
jgi:hypothetical protein